MPTSRGVFISYRRDDSAGHAGRIYDRLTAELGDDHVFMDVSSIEPGVDFTEAISSALARCDAVIVVIGPAWVSTRDRGGAQRLADPDDVVRREVEAALQRDLRVIPVLVRGATMPVPDDVPTSLAPLLRRHAFELTDAHWRSDMDSLVGLLRSLLPTGGGARDPEPAEATRGRPGTPTPPSPLVGRQELLAGIVSQVLEPGARLLTLTGPGGTGKTRLAIEVANAVGASFAGGVWFVPLAEVADAGLVLSSLATVLDVRETPEQPLLASLVDRLAGAETLVVLDNFEHVLQAASDVGELLRNVPTLSVLATSRVPLRVSGEQERPVPPLDLPELDRLPQPSSLEQLESVDLFVRRSRAVLPTFALSDANARAVAEICVRLDGLPLALELAAARTKVLTPEQLLDRLDQSLQLLVGGNRDVPDHQRTLRATLDWSFGLLSPDEQRLLGRVAVFAGPFTLEAAEDVCADPGDDLDVLQGLAALVDSSLIRSVDSADDLRFRLLRTVREYALDRLEQTGDATAVRRRHAEHMLERVERVRPHLNGPRARELLDQVAADEPDLRAAIDAALQMGDAALAGRIAVALRQFWVAEGRLTEGRARLRAVLASDTLSEEVRAQASVVAGILAYYQDYRSEEALTLLADGRDRARAGGDQESTAAAACFLGAALVADDRLDDARPFVDEALALSEEAGIYETHVLSLSMSAIVAALSGDTDEERRLYRTRLALVRQQGDHARTADTLTILAEGALNDGDLVQARAWAEEALAIARTTTKSTTRDALLALGRVALAERDVDSATGAFTEALELGVQLGEAFELSYCLRALAAASGLRGDLAGAARLFGAADRLHPTESGEEALRERDISEYRRMAREELGESRYEELWQEGAALKPEEIVRPDRS